MKKIAYILSVALMAAACSKTVNPVNNNEPQQPIAGEVKFSAVFGEETIVKSELSGSKVLWKAGDEISIIWDGGRTSAQADADGEKANFPATVDAASEYFAIYPSAASVTLNEGVLTVGIPAQQNGAFEDANIAIARTADRNLVFKNLCALGKITLSRDDIAKVEFKGNGNQNLAGNATLSLDANGVPSVSSVASPAETIVLTPASGDAFAPGSYYFAAIPSSLEQGVSFTLTTVSGNTIFGKASPNSNKLVRSEALSFGTLDNISNVNTLKLRFTFGPDRRAKATLDPMDIWPDSAGSEELDEGIAYTYAIDGVDYSFFVKDISGNRKFSWRTDNSYPDGIAMQTDMVYFGLPAIKGFKLTQVVVGQCRRGAGDNATSKITKVGITDRIPTTESEEKSYIGGGELQDWPGWPNNDEKGARGVVDHIFTLSNSEANTTYYLNSNTSSIGLYFAHLVLTYEKATE